jgi:hypothetical protein
MLKYNWKCDNVTLNVEPGVNIPMSPPPIIMLHKKTVTGKSCCQPVPESHTLSTRSEDESRWRVPSHEWLKLKHPSPQKQCKHKDYVSPICEHNLQGKTLKICAAQASATTTGSVSSLRRPHPCNTSFASPPSSSSSSSICSSSSSSFSSFAIIRVALQNIKPQCV